MKIGEVYGNANNRLLKSISTSGKSIFIDFKKQHYVYNENAQFAALFKYKKINIDCQTWLDVNTNILMSPNPPSNTNCTWFSRSIQYWQLSSVSRNQNQFKDFFKLSKYLHTIFINWSLEPSFRNCWNGFKFNIHLVSRNGNFFITVISSHTNNQIRIHTTTIIDF